MNEYVKEGNKDRTEVGKDEGREGDTIGAHNAVRCESQGGAEFGKMGPWRTAGLLFSLCELTYPYGINPVLQFHEP